MRRALRAALLAAVAAALPDEASIAVGWELQPPTWPEAGSSQSRGNGTLPVQDWGDPNRGLLVVANLRLLVCPMPNVEASALVDLAKELECAAPPSSDGRQCSFEAAARPSRVTSDDNLLAAFEDPIWTRAVLYRDPLDRLVRGYRSVCGRSEGGGGAVCSDLFGESQPSFKGVVTVLSNETASSIPSAEGAFDAFRPQRDLCLGSLEGGVREHYNYAAQLTEQNSRRVVGDLLRHVGVRQPESLASFNRRFPPLMERQAALLAKAPQTLASEFYTSKTIVRTVLRLYLADYLAFGMQVPLWAADAAGSDWLQDVGLQAQSAEETKRLATVALTSSTNSSLAAVSPGEVGASCKRSNLHSHCRCNARGRRDCSWSPYAQTRERVRPRLLNWTNDRCADTVSYLFLAGSEGMSGAARRAWSSYFDTCPKGSFTMHVHEQMPGREGGLGGLGELSKVATAVPDPVQGELRFRWSMQHAALKLYEQGLQQKTEQGCVPAWFHLISVSTVPLTPCDEVHRLLASQQPPLSLMTVRKCERDECLCDQNRPPSMLEAPMFLKSSQWSTLRRADVEFLVDPALRKARVRDWADTFTPDEHFVVNELHRAGRPFKWQAITKVSNMTCSGHPATLECRNKHEVEAFKQFAAVAVEDGMVFARKVGWRCANQAVASWSHQPASSKSTRLHSSTE